MTTATYIVQDPTLREQLAGILEPFRSTKPGPPSSNDRVKDREALRAAESRIAELEQDIGQTQDLLAQSTTRLAAEREAHDETTAKLVAVESDLAQTARELDKTAGKLDQARTQVTGRDDALSRARAEITDLHAQLNTARATAATVKPLPSNQARAKDRDAFATLARRMEDQAKTKSKGVGDILRIAARAVRDEIDTVYGPAAKAS